MLKRKKKEKKEIPSWEKWEKQESREFRVKFLLVVAAVGVIAAGAVLSHRREANLETSPASCIDKPVVYLYPKEDHTPVSVHLAYDGKLSTVYPAFDEGSTWKVNADRDGTLERDGKHYNYLYWEAEDPGIKWDFQEGYCVAGKDTAAFLEKSLAQLGLNEREANEFIVYWLPQMEKNPYNVISFQGDVYRNAAKLETKPAADTVIRVFMAWHPSEKKVRITPQTVNHSAIE